MERVKHFLISFKESSKSVRLRKEIFLQNWSSGTLHCWRSHSEDGDSWFRVLNFGAKLSMLALSTHPHEISTCCCHRNSPIVLDSNKDQISERSCAVSFKQARERKRAGILWSRLKSNLRRDERFLKQWICRSVSVALCCWFVQK